jgi:hypothetical protein
MLALRPCLHAPAPAYTTSLTTVREALLTRVNTKPFGGRALTGKLVAELLPKLAHSLNEVSRRMGAVLWARHAAHMQGVRDCRCCC